MYFKPRPILVSGTHRSGTTWCGHILNQAENIHRIHEPFNLSKRPNSPLNKWFEHVSAESSNENSIEHYINSLNWSYRNGLSEKSGKNLNKLLYLVKGYFTRINLYKDPIALASAEWFYNKLHSRNIILIRHPAAFIASLKEKSWYFDFNNFASQRKLLNKYLTDFENDIILNAQAGQKGGIIENGILLYNCLNTIIAKYRDNYSDNWFFIKHEDLSKDPLKKYHEIFDFVELDFTEKVIDEIKNTSQSQVNNDLYRNSEQNVQKWKSLLEDKEIDLIKNKTRPVWKQFYSADDW